MLTLLRCESGFRAGAGNRGKGIVEVGWGGELGHVGVEVGMGWGGAYSARG